MRLTRRTVASMAAVVQIREVEHLAAEAELQAAALERRTVAARVDGALAAHLSRETAWLGALSTSRIDLTLAPAFAEAVNSAFATLGAVRGELESAEAGREQTAQALRLAQGRLDAASTVAARLRRRVRRRVEEDRLAQVADRLAKGWARG
jgi:hypothetical protein